MSDAVVLPVDLATAALRPSEYTAALIQVLRSERRHVAGAHVLEIGSGSGVVLAALGALGAASLCGVDIEHEAIEMGAALLGGLECGPTAELLCGDMWGPVGNRRFDLIVANLPHFPMTHGEFPGRHPSWSFGGANGRKLLDPFLDGVAGHLSPGGRAIITHNGFVGLDRSRDILRRHDLSMRVALTTLVCFSDEKLVLITRNVREAEDGRTIHRYGAYVFGELHIVDIFGAASPA
jgi:release factor glutamine methyltransferase